MLYFTVHQALDLKDKNDVEFLLNQTALERHAQLRSSKWKGFSKFRQYTIGAVSFSVVNMLTNEGLLQVTVGVVCMNRSVAGF